MTAAVVLLSACASGPPRRVSEPAASIQQLSVRADGSWLVDLRIENFSSVPMRFDAVSLAVTVQLGGFPRRDLTTLDGHGDIRRRI